MKKRGQITIFIIIAVVIIVSVVLFFMFKDTIKSSFVSQEDSVYLFVENCIKETGEDAIYFTSQNGGYFIPPEFSNSEGVAYYYVNGKNYMPSSSIIEEQISNYMNNMLSFCMNDFEVFSEFEVDEGVIKTETRIKEQEVVFDVKYPLAFRKEEEIIQFENFENIKIPARLGIVYNSVEKIIQEQLTHDNLCLTCISEIVSEDDLEVDITNIGDELMFTITDEESRIKEVALKFNFVNRYE